MDDHTGGGVSTKKRTGSFFLRELISEEFKSIQKSLQEYTRNVFIQDIWQSCFLELSEWARSSPAENRQKVPHYM